MDSATDLMLDYSLVQVSDVGSSVAMEKKHYDVVLTSS